MRLIDADVLLRSIRHYLNLSFLGETTSQTDISVGGIASIISDQPIINEWIPTKERLPIKSGSYLTWYQDGFGNTGYYVLYWDDGRKGFYPKWSENTSRHELAWIELPQPYKKGE